MSDTSAIYAQSLFDVAPAKDRETILNQLISMRHVFEQNISLDQILVNKMLDQDKRDKLIDMLTRNHQQNIINLVKLLVDNERIDQINEIVADYQDIYDQANEQITATVITAVEMKTNQISLLEKQLVKKLNVKKVNVVNLVDDQIIGGVIVKTNQYMIDGSLITQLATIKNNLKGDK